MSGINVGAQSIFVKYVTPLTAINLSRIGEKVRPIGIYEGGFLSKVSDVLIDVTPPHFEISDGTYQVYIKAETTFQLNVSNVNTVIVARWEFIDGEENNYADFLAVAPEDVLATDVVFGTCVYTGATLTGFSYDNRTIPDAASAALKASPTSPASMNLLVNGGKTFFGGGVVKVPFQKSPLFVAPVSGTLDVPVCANPRT